MSVDVDKGIMMSSVSGSSEPKCRFPLTVRFVLQSHALLECLYRLIGKPAPPIESLIPRIRSTSFESERVKVEDLNTVDPALSMPPRFLALLNTDIAVSAVETGFLIIAESHGLRIAKEMAAEYKWEVRQPLVELLDMWNQLVVDGHTKESKGSSGLQ